MSENECRCDYAYLGAQAATEPIRCERCKGLVDDVAAARIEAVHAESLRRLARHPAPTHHRPQETT